MAYDCTSKDVLASYLDGENQKKWNVDKVRDIKITKMRSRGSGWYRQDMVLKPQRVLSGSTGEMRYTQVIRVDKIGNGDYNAFVELLDSDEADITSTTLRPFNILKVNVNLRQVGPNVEIQATGLMKVVSAHAEINRYIIGFSLPNMNADINSIESRCSPELGYI